FFSSRRRHTRSDRDWSSDVCSSDLLVLFGGGARTAAASTKKTELLERACVALDCDRIIAIGSRSKVSWSGQVQFEQTGVLPAAEIGRASCRERGWMWGGGGCVEEEG